MKTVPTEIETRYSIDGFRSLIGFEIGLTRGLNVLVGPNGSGKTNFIEFLDFLSILIMRGASNAVSEIGGVSRVFCHEQSKNKSSVISLSVKGIAEIEEQPDTNTDMNVFNFEYDLEVRFSKALSSVFISKEVILFRKLRRPEEVHLSQNLVGKISISRKQASLSDGLGFEISPRLQANNIRNPLRITSRFYRFPKKKEGEERRIFEPTWVGVDESLLTTRNRYPAIDAVRTSIMRGRSFNLIPNQVRSPDDLTRQPVIAQDGSGLSSVVYHLQKSAQPNVNYSRTPASRRFPVDTLESVIDWTKLVFPELRGISVSPDLHTGKYVGHLNIGDNNLRIPLQSASDGTLKWLGLVTLIITKGGVYSIEEPENFLHPKMQQYLIDLIRDFSADPERPGYFIISTHSETIINQCQPSELILFSFTGGKTTCSRLHNQDSVQEEINRTGFGLGYYYASNAVS